jgi:hypothetical protein
MIESFLTLSPALIISICVLVPIVFAGIITALILKKKIKSSEDDSTVLSPLVGFTGTAFTLLLAFVIVNVWSDQVAKQDVLFAEMTTIENILIESKVIDPVFAPKLKEKVLEYMDDVVRYEIDQKPPVGGDAKTEATFEEALVLIDKLEKELSSDPTKAAEAQSFFEETREWIQDRELRVNKSNAELDTTFTFILIFLALLTVLSVALLPSTTLAWAKWTQSLGTATAVGLVMSLVFYIASDSFTKEAEEQQVIRIEQALAKTPADAVEMTPEPTQA